MHSEPLDQHASSKPFLIQVCKTCLFFSAVVLAVLLSPSRGALADIIYHDTFSANPDYIGPSLTGTLTYTVPLGCCAMVSDVNLELSAYPADKIPALSLTLGDACYYETEFECTPDFRDSAGDVVTLFESNCDDLDSDCTGRLSAPELLDAIVCVAALEPTNYCVDTQYGGIEFDNEGSVSPASVPEPASLAIFGTYLVGFSMFSWRKRQPA